MDTAYTESLNRLIEEFAQLPGIGPKSAERLAFHVLKSNKEQALGLAQAIHDELAHLGETDVVRRGPTCPICLDTKRDISQICVVEQPKDIISLEKTGMCHWTYHVLGGHIAPLEGIEPSDLSINKLMDRIRTGEIKELIMATNPNMEGDGTSLYITSLLHGYDIKITRLARGLPSGSTIEYASGKILTDAILGRQSLD